MVWPNPSMTRWLVNDRRATTGDLRRIAALCAPIEEPRGADPDSQPEGHPPVNSQKALAEDARPALLGAQDRQCLEQLHPSPASEASAFNKIRAFISCCAGPRPFRVSVARCSARRR